MTPASPSIHYSPIGDRGHKVLLLMGLGMPGASWQSQVVGLAETCQLIHFDYRGVGNSAPINSTMTMADMVADAMGVLDAEGWSGDVHLVGVSLGGMVAQEMALAHPARFTSLALLATHAGGMGAGAVPLRGTLRYLRMMLSSGAKRNLQMNRLLYTEDFIQKDRPSNWYSPVQEYLAQPPASKTMRTQIRIMRKHDTRKRLQHLQTPTLVIKPEADILIAPRGSDRLCAKLPNATLVSVNAGHGLIYECSQQINEMLLKHFLGSANSAQVPTP